MNPISTFLRLTIFIFVSTLASFAQQSDFIAYYTSTYQDDTAPFGQVNAGDKIHYKIEIVNHNQFAITNIKLTNPPAYNAVLTGTSIASLAAGSFDDTTFSVLQTISANDITKGVIYYGAELNGNTIQGDTIQGEIIDGVSNSFLNLSYGFCADIATNLNIASFTTSITPYIIDDTAPIGTINAGDKVKSNYSFTNTGLVDLLISETKQYSSHVDLTILAGQTNTSFSSIRTISDSEINSGYMFYDLSLGRTPSTICHSDYYNSRPHIEVDSPVISTLPCYNCPTNPNGGAVFSLVQNLQLLLTGQYQDTTAPFGKANIGDAIVYTYSIKNVGNETLTNVHITDATFPVLGNPIANLAPNEVNTTNFTSTHLIESNDILVNGGWAINNAIVRGTLPSNIEVLAKSVNPENSYYYDDYYNPLSINCESCTLTRFDVYPNMVINYEDVFEDLIAPFGIANVGDKINYTITVQNTGNVNFKDVKLYKNYSTELSNSISSLVVGASDNTTFAQSHTLTQTDITRGFVSDYLYTYGIIPSIALYSDGYNFYSFSSTDPTPCVEDCPENNSSNYTITKLNSLKFYLGTYIEDTIAPFGVPNVGEEITYVYKILNNTLNDIDNIKITDTYGVVQGSLSKMPKYTEDATSFSRKHVLTQSDLDKGFVLNNATLNCTLLGDDLTINSISSNGGYHALPSGTICDNCTITYLNYEYALDFEVEDNLTSLSNVQVGDEIEYTINIKNKGNAWNNNLYNLSVTDLKRTVSDRLPGLYSYVISDYPRETSFQEVYTITADDLSKGYVYNNFILQGNTINSYPYSDEVSNFLVKSRDVTPCLSCPVDPNCSNCNITALNKNIKLNAFVDTNNNGIKDSGEFHFPLGKFYYNINDSTTMNEVTTTNGIHFLHGGNPLNTYDLSFTVLPEYAYNYSSSTTFSNVTIGDNVVTYYFPVTVLPYNDNEINLLPIVGHHLDLDLLI